MQNLERASSGPRYEAVSLPPPFLTDAELRRIAEPLRQPAAIMRWFKRAGFEVKQKPNGMPLVSRGHFDQVMRGRSPVSSGDDGDAETSSPNAAALLQRFARNNKNKVC
ncbi:DUF4224 domain-containing protein [Burkholderia ubonensis]|uniref:Uncharacterized protein n=1 Tax=Burkholderia ubonensis TaxID=101571 RepID=A0A119MF85_9BURK|nr:DUF4224 domain-containing protein [Burkholderia ubonensis]KWD74177.1 hypothetical protein WL70_26665 [Burkholderia ubonensis]KWD90472.1 hypothetical protein WL71_00010 [Burkholderia ubonensis]KWE02648.1 hypothetical protein WL72_06460 [Burkholderia ubonensis]KWE08780.1 hypothetical protein WL73_06050 [Burkholderia ubonensis]